MATFNKSKFSLIAQGITGQKVWHYEDTGALADVEEVAGYVPAGDHGVDTGDYVLLKVKDGTGNKTVRGAAMNKVQDTGSTQGTVGLSVLVGDTS
jgi:hypothetical protein